MHHTTGFPLFSRLLRFYLQSQAEAEGLIAFICSISADSAVFFFLSENSLKEVFSDYFVEDYGTLLVYNNALDVILSSLPDNKEALNSSLPRIKGTGLLILKDTEQIALRRTIGLNEMTIVTAMDKREFYRQLTNDQLILFVLILLMILCCLLFIILGVRQVRNPLHALVRNIAGNDAGRLPEDE